MDDLCLSRVQHAYLRRLLRQESGIWLFEPGRMSTISRRFVLWPLMVDRPRQAVKHLGYAAGVRMRELWETDDLRQYFSSLQVWRGWR